MSKSDVEHLLARMDPGDGLHVREVKTGHGMGAEYSLHVGVYAGGHPVVHPDRTMIQQPDQPMPRPTAMFWCRRVMKDPDHGDRQRTKLLAEALARFFNTGGTWDQFRGIMDAFHEVTNSQDFSLDLPGFHLVNSTFNTDGNMEHEFVSESDRLVIRWVEGQFIDVMSLDTFAKQVAEAEAEAELAESAELESTADVRDAETSGPAADQLDVRPGKGDSAPPPDPGATG